MTPALFVVFVILSAAVLYDMLLRPHLGFRAPGQPPPVTLATQAPAKKPSITSDQMHRPAVSKPITSPVVIQAPATVPVSLVMATEAESVSQEVPAPLIVELSAPDEHIVMPVPSVPLEAPTITPPAASVAQVEKKLLIEQEVQSSAVMKPQTRKQRTQPTLSEASKEYLDTMNRQLDQELSN